MGGRSSKTNRIVPFCGARAAIVAGISLACVVLSAAAAEAQIYVIEKEDGSRQFTNEYRPGARLFLDTYHSAREKAPMPVTVNPFRREIDHASSREGVDARLVEAVIAAESAFDPRALSKKGAQGLMQLMPETADRFDVSDVWDPLQNILGGAAYLRELIGVYRGDLPLVLAAYNAGEGAVTRYGGMPPYAETQQYVDRVLDYYRTLGGR